jgi:hypothetical protein
MWSSSKKNVDLTHFESKSSGLDSGAGLSGVSYGSSRITSSNESLETDNANSNSIAIIGSGDFGRALAKRMVQSGYTVNIGSRNPDRNRLVN